MALTLPRLLSTRADLYEAGLTPAAIRGAVARRELHRLFHGLYATVPASRLTTAVMCEAAQIHAAERLVFTCWTAVELWGMGLAGRRPLHAATLGGAHVRSTERLVVHDFLGTAPTGERVGLPVVARGLAVVQAFGCLPQEDRAAFVLDCFQRRVVKSGDLTPWIGRQTRGRRELLALIGYAESGVHSPGELAMLDRALRLTGLPEPVRQFRIDLPTGPVYVDAAYVFARVIVEYDGRDHHFSAAARAQDLERDAALAALGWVVIRCTAEQIRGTNARIFAQRVRRAVLSRRSA
jgi:very-short-patch-repair endonuclease